ncbi:arylesterase [Pseudaestuariivita sp.]|uniref:arylesterase n=1 Tax=Pseudaestuariivita sp. TaxID=2211669 RepID=UPI004058CDC4
MVFVATGLGVSTASAEPITLLAFGDSLTAGYGLPREQGFVPQMEAWLRGQGADVTLINAGVSGDTTAGGLSRIDWSLTPEVDAMILALGGNDLLRGIDPAVSRANLEGILQAAEGVEVLVVGLQAPSNYGPDYKQAFDVMHDELAETYGALHQDTFFRGLPSDEAGFLSFMQRDGIHPNADGVARIVAAMGPRVLDLLAEVE